MSQENSRKIIVRINNQEVYRKYSLLRGLNKLVIEKMLEILFQRVSPVEIQQAYIESGETGVKKFLEKVLFNFNKNAGIEALKNQVTTFSNNKEETKKIFVVNDSFWE